MPAWDDLPDEERPWFERAMEVYAARTDRMDRGIGEVVAALAALWDDWAARTGVVPWAQLIERRRATREANQGSRHRPA